MSRENRGGKAYRGPKQRAMTTMGHSNNLGGLYATTGPSH